MYYDLRTNLCPMSNLSQRRKASKDLFIKPTSPLGHICRKKIVEKMCVPLLLSKLCGTPNHGTISCNRNLATVFASSFDVGKAWSNCHPLPPLSLSPVHGSNHNYNFWLIINFLTIFSVYTYFNFNQCPWIFWWRWWDVTRNSEQE